MSSTVQALAFNAPRATSVAEGKFLESGFSPRPTGAPRIPHELLRRQAGAVQSVFVAPDFACGYFSGLARKSSSPGSRKNLTVA